MHEDRRARELVARLALNVLDHWRNGAMQVALLVGAALSIAAALVVVVRPAEQAPVVLTVSALAFAANVGAQRAHVTVYHLLRARPWIAVAIGAAWGIAIAAEGVGTYGGSLFLPALAAMALPFTVGRPAWGLAAVVTMLVATDVAGWLMREAGLSVTYEPLSIAAVAGRFGTLVMTGFYLVIVEWQGRHVPLAFLRAVTEPPLLRVPNVARPERRRLPRGAGGALPSPDSDDDIVAAARRDLGGLSARELEELLALGAGLEESELGFWLGHIDGRRPLERSTIESQLEGARRRIAEAHGVEYVTTAQAVALLTLALERRTTTDGRLVRDVVLSADVEPGVRKQRS